MSEVADLLRRARARIADPERWCQGMYAANDEGHSCTPHNPRAVMWCSVGSIGVEVPNVPFDVRLGIEERAVRLLDDAARELFHRVDGASVNDHLGHAATLTMFDRAIAQADAESEVPA